MQALVDVILPVFLLIGFGYLAVWRRLFSDAHVEALTRFTQNFAFPCLLFRAMAELDLAATFDAGLVASYYLGAIAGFAAGMAGARLLFARPWTDSVAIGFTCLYANSLLLGIPITERAFGTAALEPNYVIVAFNAPICYFIGFTAMEIARAEGRGFIAKTRSIGRAVFHNALILGIAAGLLVNVTDAPVPGVLNDAIDLMVRVALPAALFALGGILYRYRPEGDARTIAMICAISLVLTPAVTWAVGRWTGLTTEQFRSAVLTASMAPGVNAYIFANLYGVARRVVASSVLIATAGSILTIWVWLAVLP